MFEYWVRSSINDCYKSVEKRMYSYRIIYFLLCLLFADILAVGEDCVTELQNGTCVSIHDCSYARKLLKVHKKPQHCGFAFNGPVVCCLNTSEELEDVIGDKSYKKCKEYYRSRGGGFGYAFGIKSSVKEFTHMALLGYGEVNNTQWLCGGSLISEYFILTAAHCISSNSLGYVNKVRLGELDKSRTSEDARPEDYGISEIFPHPEYNPPSHYNDIALLKLDRKANISSYVSPACLHTNYEIHANYLIGTGWGKTDFSGESSSHLLKAYLNLISHEICANRYSTVSTRKLKYGIVDEKQICAGSEQGADACEGDSGGPLQYYINRNPLTKAHYAIVGIVSFGKACGVENSTGVYTRVAPYTAWIENIVWP